MDVSTYVVSQRAWVEVDLANMVENARTVQAVAGGAALLPMVKADAYGLGAAPAARALETLRPWGFGVATLAEAIELREVGVTRPIVVFTPSTPDQADTFRAHGLRAVIDDPRVAEGWPAPFHLEIDTGMARCGIRWTEHESIARCASPNLEGAFTHLHSADCTPESVAEQWDRFVTGLRALPERPPLVHVAGSAGAWRLRETLDLVRPGIFLYGGRHADDLPAPKPVASVRAPVASVRSLAHGDTVSYGADWRASRATTVATLAIGYADGVPRAVGATGRVLLRGRRRPIAGRVTMDFLMIDLGSEDARVGEVATLVGPDGEDRITVDEFAGWAGTISYETLTRFRGRLERRYTGP